MKSRRKRFPAPATATKSGRPSGNISPRRSTPRRGKDTEPIRLPSSAVSPTGTARRRATSARHWPGWRKYRRQPSHCIPRTSSRHSMPRTPRNATTRNASSPSPTPHAPCRATGRSPPRRASCTPPPGKADSSAARTAPPTPASERNDSSSYYTKLNPFRRNCKHHCTRSR